MKFQVSSQDLLAAKADLWVVFTSGEKLSTKTLAGQANDLLEGHIKTRLSAEDFKGEAGETKLFDTYGDLDAKHILVVGLGANKDLTLEKIRKASASIYGAASQVKAKTVCVEVPGEGVKAISFNDAATAVVEGLYLKSYQFTKYKEGKKETLSSVTLFGPAKFARNAAKAVTFAHNACEGAFLARDLVNTAAGDMTPVALANVAKKLKGVTTRVHDLPAIRKMKMGAFLSVAEGSTKNPPRFIEMHYKPKGKAKKKVAIIGKGVTFDSGGYSLKPPKAQETMKCDMAGSAAVVGLMSVIAKLAPKVEVSAYVAATENMVDGYATRPGDVCTSMSGKTIEILNTDAEGRLTLADALTYAQKKKPDYMIDLATLTGACMVALGLQYAGVMTNDEGLLGKLQAASATTGENIWQLPLADEYRDEMKSPIADLRNAGIGYAGSITAGIFLENFVEGTKWAHLDIAGPAWTNSNMSYIPRGGSGVMVRTLAKFLNDL